VREPSDYSDHFAERLRSLGFEPVLIGALAANVYRLGPRLTTDVDFLTRSLVGLAEALEADGLDVHTMAEPGEAPYVAFIRGDGIRVDVVAAQTDYQLEAFERARDGVLTVEDVIVHKLIAWRARDRDDIDQILAAGHVLDDTYLERWIAAWQVEDRWREARRRFA
jgi:hypothetical protein